MRLRELLFDPPTRAPYLVQLLTKYYQLNFLKPKLHSVPLTDGSVATVQFFDAKALLIAFLNDPLRMRQENFASNYDIFT
jgi:hypothetical protein